MRKDKSGGFGKFVSENYKPFLLALATAVIVFIVFKVI